jgi:hypothetical protein
LKVYVGGQSSRRYDWGIVPCRLAVFARFAIGWPRA